MATIFGEGMDYSVETPNVITMTKKERISGAIKQ